MLPLLVSIHPVGRCPFQISGQPLTSNMTFLKVLNLPIPRGFLRKMWMVIELCCDTAHGRISKSIWHQPTPGRGHGISTEEPKDQRSPGNWHGVTCSADTCGEGPHGGLDTRGWGPPGEEGSRDAQGVQARRAHGQTCLLSPPLRP